MAIGRCWWPVYHFCLQAGLLAADPVHVVLRDIGTPAGRRTLLCAGFRSTHHFSCNVLLFSHIVRGYLLKGPAGGRYMRCLICLVSAFWLGVFMTLTCTAHRTTPDVKGLPYPVCSCLGLIPLSMSMTMVFPRQFAPFSRPLLSRGLTIGRRIRTCISHSFWASG